MCVCIVLRSYLDLYIFIIITCSKISFQQKDLNPSKNCLFTRISDFILNWKNLEWKKYEINEIELTLLLEGHILSSSQYHPSISFKTTHNIE